MGFYMEPTLALCNKCLYLLNLTDLFFQVNTYKGSMTYQTSALFILSCFIYINTSLAFNRGAPFCSPIYKNKLFVLNVLFLYAFTICLIMYLAPMELLNFMSIRVIPDIYFMTFILGLSVAHCVISILFDHVVVESSSLKQIIKKLKYFCFSNAYNGRKYKEIISSSSVKLVDEHLGGTSFCKYITTNTTALQEKRKSIVIGMSYFANKDNSLV